VDVDTNRISAGECEDYIDTPLPERMQKFDHRKIHVKHDASASGGHYTQHHGAKPPWVMPFDAGEAGGLFQLAVRARGDIGGNTYPTIAVYVDDRDAPMGSVRLAGSDWHRVAVGAPFTLTRGSHTLMVNFENDFYVAGAADRNLYLDAFDVVRLEGDGPTSPDAMASMMMAPMMGGGASGAPATLAILNIPRPRLVTGRAIVRGQCSAGTSPDAPPPTIDLVINDRVVSSQQTEQPVFVVSQSQLQPGDNRLQLATRGPDGVRSGIHILQCPRETTSTETPHAYHRYAVTDPGWSDNMQALLDTKPAKAASRHANFYSQQQVRLELPPSLSGEYDVSIEARGTPFEGKPIFAVAVLENDLPIGQFEAKLKRPWDDHSLGTVRLGSGPKALLVAFINDRYEPGVGDRNAFLKAVTFERSRGSDTVSPAVTIVYPPDRHHIDNDDVIVAEAWDDRDLASVDLLIDGEPMQMDLQPVDGLGRIVFPFSTRGLNTGLHRIEVVARDRADNASTSRPLSITVLKQPATKLSAYERAIHLLNRFAFGPEPQTLADLLVQGESAWLAQHLPPGDQPDGIARDIALLAFPNLKNQGQLPARVMKEVLVAANPVRSRFALWSQNHFSTWLNKTGVIPKWQEAMAFADMGLAPFRELLLTSATSPAMLTYLDQDQSFNTKLNENYAREIMELHTLGVDGGYTQQDVTQLAHLLTGWMVVKEANVDGLTGKDHRAFRFSPELNDHDAQLVLGQPFTSDDASARFDDIQRLLEILSAHPSTARHVSRKLAEHYVAVPAPPAIVDALTRRYLETGGNMRELLLVIARHPDFWDAANRHRVSDPLEFGLRLSALTDEAALPALVNFLSRSGMGFFDRVTPDGYPYDDHAFANSNAMLQRWRYVNGLKSAVIDLLPDAWRHPPTAGQDAWVQRAVDYLAIRMTGHRLGDPSNDAIMTYVRNASKTDKSAANNVAVLLCQMPEFNLR
ncbi:MAG: DUF1800 family protein, partial [Verrucomicrobia bacterium]|nr:DUF1800 family protein [Verrucomicrobiota bacterium]